MFILTSIFSFIDGISGTCLPPFRRASVIMLFIARFALQLNEMLSRPAHSMCHVSYRLVIARPRDGRDLDMIFFFFFFFPFYHIYHSHYVD